MKDKARSHEETIPKAGTFPPPLPYRGDIDRPARMGCNSNRDRD